MWTSYEVQIDLKKPFAKQCVLIGSRSTLYMELSAELHKLCEQHMSSNFQMLLWDILCSSKLIWTSLASLCQVFKCEKRKCEAIYMYCHLPPRNLSNAALDKPVFGPWSAEALHDFPEWFWWVLVVFSRCLGIEPGNRSSCQPWAHLLIFYSCVWEE